MTGGLIDRRGHLAQLAVQAVLGTAAFVTLSWVPLAAAAVLFGVSAVLWPRGAVVLRLWDHLASRRGARWLDDGRPTRISTALAAVNFAGLAIAVALGMDTSLMWIAVLVLSAALVAEVIIGACVPCELIVFAARRGWLRFRTPIGDTT
jgi:hypothetical protein